MVIEDHPHLMLRLERRPSVQQRLYTVHGQLLLYRADDLICTWGCFHRQKPWRTARMRIRTSWTSQRKRVMNLESLTTSGLNMVSCGPTRGKIEHPGYWGDRSPLWTTPLGCDINTGSLAFSFPCTAIVSVIVAWI